MATFDCYRVLRYLEIMTLVHVVVSIMLYIAMLLKRKLKEKCMTSDHDQSVKLLITAHPDDECMFFSPLLLQSQSQTGSRPCRVHLLCLTNGNYYGQGKMREKEILDSCQTLGIPGQNVTVINDSQLPDDPRAVWADNSLESHLCAAVTRIQPKQIFTFDDYGVSGHGNHIRLSSAVRKLFQDGKKFKGVETVHYLESVGVWRKYLGVFDLPFTCLFSTHVCLLAPRDALTAQRAMLCHRSQLVWFRFLYIVFSRFMLINTFHVENAPPLAFSEGRK